MLLVSAVLKPSPINGLGLFAAEPIPAGAEIWRYEASFDPRYTLAEVDALPAVARDFVHHFGYPVGGGWDLFEVNGDNMRFLNHSEAPNVANEGEERVIAVRDIAPGEEILCDYRDLYEAGTPAWVYEITCGGFLRPPA